MFARINHELAEREALEQQRQELLKKKQGLIADNKKRKDDLANLDKDLETFIDVRFPPFCCWFEGWRWCLGGMLMRCRLRNRYRRYSRSSIEASVRSMALKEHFAWRDTQWQFISVQFNSI